VLRCARYARGEVLRRLVRRSRAARRCVKTGEASSVDRCGVVCGVVVLREKEEGREVEELTSESFSSPCALRLPCESGFAHSQDN
jgi:hypothetical protein